MDYLIWIIAISVGIISATGLLIILMKKRRRDAAKCGRHDVIVNVYETLNARKIEGLFTWFRKKRGKETKEPEPEEGIDFHIQMTEFMADMLSLNEFYRDQWDRFLNTIWYDYHERLGKGLPQRETYWFGERPEKVNDKELEKLMKAHKISPKDLK